MKGVEIILDEIVNGYRAARKIEDGRHIGTGVLQMQHALQTVEQPSVMNYRREG